VHTGEADLGVDDYYGIAVNRCARLRSIAHGGQVLVSESTAGLVRETLPEEMALRDLGFQRLRDLAEPERVSQLLHASLPSDFPALRTIDLAPNNLPYQVSAFIGRDEEMGRIKELLRGTRLLTLTGAGGVGKTRLALQAAAEMLYEYPDGVWLVELAALSDGGLVWQALATALSVREEPGQALAETVLAHLSGRQVLLLLDNCEHVVDASAALAEQLTQRCSGVRILTTSREALRAEGETVWRVPSLSVPHRVPGVEPQPEQLTQYAAVRLFVDRAMKVKPGFAMTNENAPAVAEICARLEGVPLAIELAAARANMLSPEQIEERLDERFRLLTGGRRTALPRQRTLEATVRWSYELLPEKERRLFARLSVFAGGFTLDAAEAVCSGDGISSGDIADLVGELLSKSLMIPGKDRYWMLETLRAYGVDRLGAWGEAACVRAAHARHFLGTADVASRVLPWREEITVFAHVEAEMSNLRRTLEWAADNDVTAGLELAHRLSRYWMMRGHWTEALDWLSRLIPLCPASAVELRAGSLLALGNLHRRRGDLVAADAAVAEALDLYRSCGSREGEAGTLVTLGNSAVFRGDYDDAERLYSRALCIGRELGSLRIVAGALHGLGLAAEERGDPSTAHAHYEECLALYRDRADRYGEATILNNLGNLAYRAGDSVRARDLYRCALVVREELGDLAGIAMSLGNLGVVAEGEGDMAEAEDLYRRALDVVGPLGAIPDVGRISWSLAGVLYAQGKRAEATAAFEDYLAMAATTGVRRQLAEALCSYAVCLASDGRHDEARKLYLQGLDVALEQGRLPDGAKCLEGLAVLEHDLGCYEDAVRLFAAGEALREQIGAAVAWSPPEEYSAKLAATRQRAGEEVFQSAWAQGRAT
jgi:predicted ATPase/Tfp pilus assembly protein PilF